MNKKLSSRMSLQPPKSLAERRALAKAKTAAAAATRSDSVFKELKRETKTVLRFQLAPTHVSYANTLRRAMITDVETVGFVADITDTGSTSNVTIHANSTPMSNEMLAHRIGLIPIHVSNPNEWNPDEYTFKLNVKNDSTDSIDVVAGDIQVYKNRGPEEEPLLIPSVQLFHPDPVTHDTSLLAVLKGRVGSQEPEVRMMLLGFAAREALHIAAYSHLIETLGLPDTMYNQFLEYQAMRDKHDYVLNLSSQNGDAASTATHIAVFSAFTEGMQLFSSFIMLLNFPRHGKMKGMGQIVTWSIVDETQHAEAMIKLFRTYIEENKEIWNDELKGKIYTIAEKMVDLEDKFIELAFRSGAIEGLTENEVKEYIRYIADRRLISLGLKGIFKRKKNPLPWVEEMINAPTHTNFFENRATDYAKGALSGNWNDVWGKAA